MDYEPLLPTAADAARPSWARADWPLAAADDLTTALDASGILLTPKPAKGAAADGGGPRCDPSRRAGFYCRACC